MDSKFAITYQVSNVVCKEPIRDDELPGYIKLTLETICVGDVKNPSYCSIGKYCEPITLYLNKETAHAHGIDWNGTLSDIDRIKRSLEGKTFELSLGIKS